MEKEDTVLDYSDEEGSGEQPMDVDKEKEGAGGTGGGHGQEDEVFVLGETNKEKGEKKGKDKKKAREEAVARERREAEEAAKAARDLGLDVGARAARAKVDPRYKQVRVERAQGGKGREMNRKRMEDSEEEEMVGFLFQDERWLRNYSIHSTNRAVNISCSMNPKTGLYYTCIGEPHKAREGRNGEPIVLVLTDQHFPANTPAMDGGECVRVVRVEDGNFRELVEELLRMLKRWMLAPGSLIMFGSVSAQVE